MICEIRWPKPNEHCTWCDKPLHPALDSKDRVMVDGRDWVYCSLSCLLQTNRAVVEAEIIDAY